MSRDCLIIRSRRSFCVPRVRRVAAFGGPNRAHVVVQRAAALFEKRKIRHRAWVTLRLWLGGRRPQRAPSSVSLIAFGAPGYRGLALERAYWAHGLLESSTVDLIRSQSNPTAIPPRARISQRTVDPLRRNDGKFNVSVPDFLSSLPKLPIPRGSGRFLDFAARSRRTPRLCAIVQQSSSHIRFLLFPRTSVSFTRTIGRVPFIERSRAADFVALDPPLLLFYDRGRVSGPSGILFTSI